MAGEWINCKLADACRSIDYGLTASAADSAVGPRFLRITDIVSGHIDWNSVPYVTADDETVKKCRLDDGDIVLARTGASTGTSCYVSNPPSAIFASYLVRLKAKQEFDSRFLAYYLKSDAFWSYMRGVLGDKSAQPNASASTMTKAPLHAPRNKAEQRAIAHILGTLDDKIELNQRMNATLEEMARAVFKSWFVDFDPVRAKLALSEVEGAEGRDTGLPREIADLFPDGFEDSELGDVPEGWEVTGLHAVAVLKKESVKPMQAPAKLWEHYSIPAFDAGRAPAVETGANIKSSKYRVPTASILVSKLNPRFPRVWLPDVQDEEAAVCSTEFMSFVPLHYAWRPFLYELMKSDVVQRGIQERVTGSTGSRQRARPEDVAVMRIVVPSPELIETFGRIVGPLHEKTLNCICESRTLAALRDALLPKLISGELRVGDAARYLAV